MTEDDEEVKAIEDAFKKASAVYGAHCNLLEIERDHLEADLEEAERIAETKEVRIQDLLAENKYFLNEIRKREKALNQYLNELEQEMLRNVELDKEVNELKASLKYYQYRCQF